MRYLETLRTREWRGGFNQNLFREWDQKEDAARSGQGALQAECDQLKVTIATLNSKVLEHDERAAKLQATAAADAATIAKRTQELQDSHRARAELHSRIDGLEGDRKRLEAELEVRGRELGEARTTVPARFSTSRRRSRPPRPNTRSRRPRSSCCAPRR